MSFSLAVEKRNLDWFAYVREVPNTGSLGPTVDAAVAGALRKLTEKVERHELPTLETLTAEAAPPGQKEFTGAALASLWQALPHAGPSFADALDDVVRAQSTIGEEPSPWER